MDNSSPSQSNIQQANPLCWAGPGNSTQLLHQTHLIKYFPMFDGLATLEAVDSDSAHSNRSTCCGNTHQFSFVSASCRPVGDNFVSFSHLVLNLDVYIGEGGNKSAVEHFAPFKSWWEHWREGVINESGAEISFQSEWVLLVEALVKEIMGSNFVLFSRHDFSPSGILDFFFVITGWHQQLCGLEQNDHTVFDGH